jgi:adenylate cyclase
MAERAERRLVTILAADVAEYSRLMRADEDATLAALGACRRVIDARIAEHKGRIANTAGDAVLAEFPSVADGLACALAIQEGLAEQNRATPPDRRMTWRIGLHLGDVMVRDGDLYGDAVNIAARLEGLAEPGGICASATMREHVGARVAAAFTDAGMQRVKNIAEPIRVYRVASAAAPAASPAALALPDKPSLAVLPFANMSSDPEQEFLADGIAEDVITALSRYPSLFVIARNSSFTYKGRAVDVKQVGRELGVRYVLEGSLRKSGSRIRVTAQLVEADSGNHVWAEHYDRDLADIFAVQDEITEKVTIAVAPAVAEAERHRAMRKPPGSLDAWAAYQRGLWHFDKVTVEDNRFAERYFQQAIDLDPSFAGAYAGLAYARTIGPAAFGTGDLHEASRSSESLARRAMALDPANAEAYCCLSRCLFLRGDLKGSLAEAERALALCPNLASAHWRKSHVLLFSGQPREALAAAEMALRLDPRGTTMFLASQLLAIAIGHYYCREYEAAVEAAERAIRSYPRLPLTYRWLAAALGQLGRTEDAKAALDQAIAIAPASFDMYVHNPPPWFRPEDHAHMLDGLRKAGWRA